MWKQVPGHPAYEVSDDGQARRGNRIVGRKVAKNGYRRLWMDGKEYALHRVILETFVSPAPEGAVGRHLNDDRSDNRLGNLAWGTPQDNVDDMLRNSGHWESRKATCKRGHQLADNPHVPGHRYCPTCKADWRHRTGRTVKGYNPNRKLTVEEVDSLRAEYVPGKRGEYARLGREYGVSGTQARNIVLGKQRGVSAWPTVRSRPDERTRS